MRMSPCKSVLDDDRIIELNVEDYLEGVDIVKGNGLGRYDANHLKEY